MKAGEQIECRSVDSEGFLRGDWATVTVLEVRNGGFIVEFPSGRRVAVMESSECWRLIADREALA